LLHDTYSLDDMCEILEDYQNCQSAEYRGKSLYVYTPDQCCHLILNSKYSCLMNADMDDEYTVDDIMVMTTHLSGLWEYKFNLVDTTDACPKTADPCSAECREATLSLDVSSLDNRSTVTGGDNIVETFSLDSILSSSCQDDCGERTVRIRVDGGDVEAPVSADTSDLDAITISLDPTSILDDTTYNFEIRVCQDCVDNCVTETFAWTVVCGPCVECVNAGCSPTINTAGIEALSTSAECGEVSEIDLSGFNFGTGSSCSSSIDCGEGTLTVLVDGVEIDDQSSPISWNAAEQKLVNDLTGEVESSSRTVTFRYALGCLGGAAEASFTWSSDCDPCLDCVTSGCLPTLNKPYIQGLSTVTGFGEDDSITVNLGSLNVGSTCGSGVACGDSTLTVSVDGVEIDDQSSPISWNSATGVLDFDVSGISDTTVKTVTFSSQLGCISTAAEASFTWTVFCGPCAECLAAGCEPTLNVAGIQALDR